jgi:hypothetical protein
MGALFWFSGIGRQGNRSGMSRCLSAVAVLLLLLVPAQIHAEPLRLLVYDDSLSSGLFLQEGFQDVLSRELHAAGRDVLMLKGSVPGETTGGAVQRLPATLASGADLVIVELGGNDMLDGIDPRLTFANLDWIVRACKAAGARDPRRNAVSAEIRTCLQSRVRFDLSEARNEVQGRALPVFPARRLRGSEADAERWQASERARRAEDRRVYPAARRTQSRLCALTLFNDAERALERYPIQLTRIPALHS